MLKLSLALSAMLLCLSACEGSDSYSIKADDGQLGSGTMITMIGKAGRIRSEVLPGYAKGLDEAVTEVERTSGPTGGTWKIETEHKMVLSFIVVSGGYICDSCNAVNLPLSWHREKSRK
jgi:hypothetical protein